MRIIKERKFGTTRCHLLTFWYADSTGAGYSFPCDETGKVDVASLCEAAHASYNGCLAGEMNGFQMRAPFVHSFDQDWIEDAEGRCECGRVVVLSGFTNTCDCGRDYSRSGQELAPRSQWGEDTGESLSEVLAIR